MLCCRYHLQALRAVNQALGRCIRSKYVSNILSRQPVFSFGLVLCRANPATTLTPNYHNFRNDYGAILFLDERYCREDVLSGLSKWVSAFVKRQQSNFNSNSSGVLSSLKSFFNVWSKGVANEVIIHRSSPKDSALPCPVVSSAARISSSSSSVFFLHPRKKNVSSKLMNYIKQLLMSPW